MTELVGIIYSAGCTGWSTWGEPETTLDQELAHALSAED